MYQLIKKCIFNNLMTYGSIDKNDPIMKLLIYGSDKCIYSMWVRRDIFYILIKSQNRMMNSNEKEIGKTE